ncbi:cation-translocating P-type ATPase [Solitalea lacus]|uniref:cation-translocating P-type ATPase n=1 Tax=Solitalea lacus TaxID=2911172 RepID=UPI001EDACBB3|nr:cation-transporting P-type ATPase [Solitalea lacus]UKJ06702.1 cation-transporting P-type ATPase [Solitalea lacus]
MDSYSKSVQELVSDFQTSVETGLTEQESINRLNKYGANLIQKTSHRSGFQVFLEQFKNLLVILLIFAAALSFFLQSYRDGVILLLIVFFNALVGFYQDWKSENILASLKSLIIEKCCVLRSGNKIEIPSSALVPGDVVFLYEGDGVPADIRLIDSSGLSANEFILTGESQPREKSHQTIQTTGLSISEQDNCVFMGTSIAKGEAKGIVISTGMKTELGKIAAASLTIDTGLTPLQRELNSVGKKITYITLLLAAILFAGRLLYGEHYESAIMFAIGVAAAMVPEGLPAQISVSLALGVARLAKNNAIVKNLSSVETLGAATVIASDKTGTITKNEMTIIHCHFNGNDYTITGIGYEPKGQILDIDGNVIEKNNLGDDKVFFLDGFLASTGKANPPDKYHPDWYPIGDPTECAFTPLIMKGGYSSDVIEKEYPKVQSFPFDSFRKRISIIREHKGKYISFVKGSIESILEKADKIMLHGKVKNLTQQERENYLNISKVQASNAHRIIATAYRDLPLKKEPYTIQDAEEHLIFAGFVTMIDPPHEEVRQAIQTAYEAGMKIIMITGDNEITAKAIANLTGICNEDGNLPDLISENELKKMSNDQLNASFGKRSLIFSRVSPDEKLRIVSLLKEKGEIVAVTGDGVNDTLSLKRSDIGVAMGKHGSKVAQEAANMVLLDDNFSTIVLAIKEGRTIYINLKKIVLANLIGNTAELTCILIGFAGAFMGYPLVLMPVHILLIDLIGNMLPLLMVTFDPTEKDVMKQAPRKLGEMLNRRSLFVIIYSGIFKGLFSFAAYFQSYNHHLGDAFRHEKAVTVTMISLIVCQFVNIFSIRTSKSIFTGYFFSNKNLFLGVGLSTVFMLIVSYTFALNVLLHTGPLSAIDWLYILTGALVYLFFLEGMKVFSTRRSLMLKSKKMKTSSNAES